MYTYEDVIPSLIPNTKMQKRINNEGIHTTYVISPVDGYVLHDKVRDWTDVDPDTMSEVFHMGYTSGYATCAESYDFTPVVVKDGEKVEYTAYGKRRFFAVPKSEVISG